MTTVGLVLGKFAPLHKGHQLLIERALGSVDRLYVLVYEDDGLSKVSLTRRQLYWYERKREAYEAKDMMNAFLAEYAADPDECFTFSGRTLISPMIIQRCVDQARGVAGVFEVGALMDLEPGARG